MLTRMRTFWKAAGRLGSGQLAPGRWFLVTTLASLGALALAALTVYAVDPFQVYRKPHLLKPVYDDAYYTLPGVIRHHEYDGLVVGSSMCQNFRISDVRTQLGWDCIKLTPAGCRPATTRLLVEMACARRPVKHVLLGIDVLNFGGPVDAHRIPLPEYLYDDNLWNDYRYLWNKTVLFENVHGIFKANFLHKEKYRQKLDADRMWAWDFEDGRKKYGRATVMQESLAQGWAKLPALDAATPTRMRESLEINIIAVARAHPETEFILFFPPYSVLAWLRCQESGNLDKYLDFKLWCIPRLLHEPNVKLYDFQADRGIIGNFDHYRDATHYSPAISHLILERMAAGQNRITAVDPATQVESIRAAVAEFAAAEAAAGTPGAPVQPR